ncbi:MAG: GNAT family N-acetyltransferase [Bacteroidia bacterium]
MNGLFAIPAKASDWPEIKTLLRKLKLDQKDTDVNQFYVIKVDGKIVGAGRLVYHDSRNVELCSIGVYRTERNQGFGKAIVETLIYHSGNNSIWLVSEIPDYFEKLGFNATTKYPPSLQEKKDRCIKQLDCSSPKVMKYTKL